MRIATNAGGLFGFTMSVFDLETEIGRLESRVEETISALGSVRNATTQINGGVGVLQPALDALNARISTEEDKLEGIRTVKQEAVKFLDFMTETDRAVAKRVRQNKEEFYQAYPHLKPPDPPKEKNFFEKGLEFVGGLYQDGKEFVKDVWNAGKEFVIEGWNNLKDLATEAWNGLVEWYETSGAKEIFSMLKDIALFTVGAIVTLTPPLSAFGVVMLGAAAIDLGCSIGAKSTAFSKKRQALKAERNGDTEKAKRLREEAEYCNENSTLRDYWANDGKTNGWDLVGFVWTGAELYNFTTGFGDFKSPPGSGMRVLENIDMVNGGIGTIDNLRSYGDLSNVHTGIPGNLDFDFDLTDVLKAPPLVSPILSGGAIGSLV